ncbi:metal-dependent hydrolase [Pseudogracilibacillus sp. SO30301A]|uniref:metal-dependent hydrolase n=1 Tax=Pseudogracilibacillus sp. SO30301A TaxID=3098291 RepID=UPI00300E19D6
MDTGTHVVMGIALGGLATLDPVVANDPALFNAVLVGTLVGSQAPDFDTILKLKNNAVYIRNHRGLTHSIPAVIFWGIFISAIIYLFAPEINFLHLWLWTFFAVIVHVFVDIFNAYGTQAFRPFSHKWVALGFINTFDPYIFFLHVGGIIAWILGANPGTTFLIIYAVIILYYIKRYFDKREIVKKIEEYFPNTEQVATSPTMKQNYWRVAVTTKDRYYVGNVDNGHIQLMDEFERIDLPKSEIIEIAKTDKNIEAFLSFSPVYRWEIVEYEWFTEVRFIDLRYRSKGYYPFVAVAQIDDNLSIISSYTGWIFSEQKLQKKLFFEDNPT